MIGLAFLAAFVVYLIVCIIVISLAVKSAKKNGRSPWKWGIGAALVMYHLVFWDLIPTMIVYKYYCATKAGFWVYKTPDQWKVENPGVAETLTWRDMSPDYEASGVTFGYQLNERIVWVDKQKEGSIIPVDISEELIVDIKTDEILVRQVGVSGGYSGEKGFIKFWTNWPYYNSNAKEFRQYKVRYKKLGRKVK